MTAFGFGRMKLSQGSMLIRLPMKRIAKHPDFAFNDKERVKVTMSRDGRKIVIEKID